MMLAYTYIEKGKFALVEKPKRTLIQLTDAIVRVTISSISSSDLYIKHGSLINLGIVITALIPNAVSMLHRKSSTAK